MKNKRIWKVQWSIIYKSILEQDKKLWNNYKSLNYKL